MNLAHKHYQIRELLHEQGVIFCYSGYMNENILTGIGQAIKQKLVLEEADTNTVNGVFSIFVEQMQNVIRYSAEREPDTTPAESVLSYGTLTVGREGDAFFVTCGNKVENSHADRLREQLTMISQLDRTGLKNLYKQILRGEVPEGSKGAGVGFVDIAKRASRPIEFDFMLIDENYSFFSLKAII
ncbi:MAG: hypothetical protein G8345_11270 [Magnetococcales bacterium]|nr:hypothetical protein [Magnetococcales bacterium]NGZ27453.1 hypothetical protein [Magnetococcales bacterium]